MIFGYTYLGIPHTAQIPIDQLADVLASTGMAQEQIDALIAAQRSLLESQPEGA